MSELGGEYDKILYEIENYLIRNGAVFYLHLFLRFNYDKIRRGEVTLILAPSDEVMQRLGTQSNKSITDICEIPEGIDFLNNFLSGTPIGNIYPIYTAINGTTFGQTTEDLAKLNFVADKKFGDVKILRIANFNQLSSIISSKFGNVTVAVINSGIKRNQQQINSLAAASTVHSAIPKSNIIGGKFVTVFDDLPNPIIRQVVLNLSPTNIDNICRTSLRFNSVVCESEDFWNEKMRRDRPDRRGIIGGSWKETYRLTGRLYTFGSGENGKLGHGDAENQLRPKWVEDLVNVTSVSCGGQHTAAVSGGQLYTFGHESYNPTGQLRPKLIEGLNNVTVISAGQEATDVISDGKLYLYTQIDYGHFDPDSQENQLELEDTPPNLTFVSDSPNISHEVIVANGQVFSRGRGEFGELGLGNVNESEPFSLVSADENMQPLNNVTFVSCGYHHTAVVSNGRLYTFGSGGIGQLGHGDQQNQFRPKLVEGLDNVTIVACGESHTAVVSNGRLYTFGYGSQGRLGHDLIGNEYTPRLVGGLENVTFVACGYAHTAVISNGQLYTFGAGEDGQLGHGNSSAQLIPKLVEGLPRVSSVSCGFNHTAAIIG